jgi:uncharacterized protein (DUF952 family)
MMLGSTIVNREQSARGLVPCFRVNSAAMLRQMTQPVFVYRLLSADAWESARREGRFLGTEHDLRDGFIHFSTAAQVAETAARHYAGQVSLILLWVRTAALGAALRFEPSRGGALFPHLYAELPVTAVARAEPLPLADGTHRFPPGLE